MLLSLNYLPQCYRVRFPKQMCFKSTMINGCYITTVCNFVSCLFHFFTLVLPIITLKVTDFGLSILKSGHGVDKMMDDFCGTPLYMGMLGISS